MTSKLICVTVGTVAGAYAYLRLTVLFWNLFSGEAGPASPMVFGFALLKGLPLGALVGYAAAICLAREWKRAASFCIRWGLFLMAGSILFDVVTFITKAYDPTTEYWRLALAWDGSTWVWATTLLTAGFQLRKAT